MGSALRHICAVLAVVAVVLATDIAFAQPIGSAPPDIRTGVYRGHVVTYEIIDGLAVWDGDIVLGTPEELDEPSVFAAPNKALDISTKALVAERSKEGLWPGGIIPYVIDPELINPHVPDAIQHWNENTVIRLVERTDQPNWVRFVSTDSGPCRATLGMVGGEQKIWLKEFCGVGVVVHEIGHAIGLWHEQQRNDRDFHVWVSPRLLIRRTLRTTFEQPGGRELALGPYDYGSVMHNSWTGYKLNTIPPGIVRGQGGPHPGSSSDRGLSPGDIDGISRLYGKIPTRTTVTTNLAGLMIEVDGEAYIAPHSFDWAPGSSHTIGVSSPQKLPGADNFIGADYIRFLFAKWSDGGSQSHLVTASSSTTVFIANFIQQIRSEYSPPQGGTVRFDPPSAADGFYTIHSFVKTIAEPAEGFSFERWGGGFSIGGGFSTNPRLSSVYQHHPALFTRRTLTTIDTNVPGSSVLVDGSQTRLPANFAWESGSTHTLGLGGCCSGVIQFGGELPQPWAGHYRLVFNGWSDGGNSTHEITVSGEPTTITAGFTRQFKLNTGSVTGMGVVKIEPSSLEYHDPSSSVRLTAQPAPGFKFVTWFGDLSGNENPKSLLMDSHKWVRAIFLDSQSFESDRLISRKPVEWLSGPGSRPSLGYNGYWISVPTGATQLAIHLVTATQGADVDLYANREYRPGGPTRILGENNEEIVGYASQYLSTGPGGNESITITPESSPPLGPGLYFIAINVRTAGVRVKGTLTAEVNVSESAISATVPVFGFPASLLTKTVKGENPPPQALEIRNSGGGTLDYQITTDQSWLSVSPNHGSSTGETDTVLITVDPVNLGAGAFEGVITIAAPPAWPVKVPVTLIVTEGQFALDFAHFANGEGITSDLVLVNIAALPIRPALYFYDKSGNPIAAETVVDLTGDLEITEDGSLTVQTEMDPLGELTISTHGQGEVVSGSVKVVSDGPIGGVLRFDLPGIGVAGVGASPPVRDALFPARRQAGGISTAAAIHNPGEEAMVVSCRLMKGGAVLEEVEIPLEANGQEAQFIEEMFTTTDTSGFVGSVRCTAPGRFTGVAVELDAGNRIFTTLPVVPVNLRGRGREAVLDFAHFANGEGITSDLVFVNVETEASRPAPTPFHTAIPPIRPALYFYDKEGNPIAAETVVEITGDLEITEDGSLTVQTEMDPLGELTISTHGQGEVVSGSVKVVSNGPIGGVLRFDLPGIGVAGVGASPPVRDALFPARREGGGISTAAAIHNMEEEAIVVSCRLMKEGAVLEETEIPLAANGQEARYIEELFPRTDTSDFVGSVRCTAPGEGAFTGVAVELDASNQIFTTLPVVPVPEMPSQE